jgi:hypothetical protein
MDADIQRERREWNQKKQRCDAMIQNDSVLNKDINATKTASLPSHDHLLSDTPDATELGKTEEERLDKMAMESARRAQNRVHANEGRTPGSEIFTK